MKFTKFAVEEQTPLLVIQVYLDNGVIYEYDVKGALKAREHASGIALSGYHHNDGRGGFEHYPPHRILKVKVTGDIISTFYPDRVVGA